MRCCVLATLLLTINQVDEIQYWMEQAYYPVLFVLFLVASLGIPLPEDVPLIAAGVLLHSDRPPGSWPGTLVVSMVGIMSGDLILYALGRRWGADVLNHRSVRWLVTPRRFARMTAQFQRHGTWMCFAGRFILGVRAAMCVTAGALRFPYWRFLLADFAGAVVSIPLFLLLGYWFADMVPTLLANLKRVDAAVTAGAAIAVMTLVVVYLIRRRRRARRIAERRTGVTATSSADTGAGPAGGGDDRSATMTPRAQRRA